METFSSLVGGVLGFVVLLAFVAFVIIVPANMARDRGRSQIGWVFVSCAGSPFLAIILLYLLGPVSGQSGK